MDVAIVAFVAFKMLKKTVKMAFRMVIVAVILLIALVGGSVVSVTVILAINGWMVYARLTRGVVLSHYVGSYGLEVYGRLSNRFADDLEPRFLRRGGRGSL